jgi:hypothetical protein
MDFTRAALCMPAAAKLVDPKGAMLAISSAAGDRGRKSNYIYGRPKRQAGAVGARHGQ